MSLVDQRSVLLVDDEPLLVELLKSYLEPLGLKVFTAGNGRTALQTIENNSIHAVISDIAMPDMDGLSFLAALKLLPKPVPVPMLTAFGDSENILQALRLGAVDFLQKPFDENEVIAVTTRLVEMGVRMARLQAEVETSQSAHEKKMIGLLAIKGNEERKRNPA